MWDLGICKGFFDQYAKMQLTRRKTKTVKLNATWDILYLTSTKE